MQLIGINRFTHIIAIYQKDLSNKAQHFSEYSLLSSFNVTKWLFFLSSYKNSLSVPLFEKFLGSPFLFSHLQWSLWVTSWLTLQYLATSARKNLCVPATITQAERVFSWMEWLLKKEGFVCQENLSTCNYSWRTVMGFRLLLSLRCVFDNKLNPFISGNGYPSNGFIFSLLNLFCVDNHNICTCIFKTFAKQ